MSISMLCYFISIIPFPSVSLHISCPPLLSAIKTKHKNAPKNTRKNMDLRKTLTFCVKRWTDQSKTGTIPGHVAYSKTEVLCFFLSLWNFHLFSIKVIDFWQPFNCNQHFIFITLKNQYGSLALAISPFLCSLPFCLSTFLSVTWPCHQQKDGLIHYFCFEKEDL